MTGQFHTPFTSNEQAPKFLENRWSLLVGVDHAPASNKHVLEHAEDDIRQMTEVLQEHCGFPPVREPLLGEAATSANVMRAIGQFIQARKDDDFLLFYFSGHGVACRLGETNGDDDIYLVTADFSFSDVSLNPKMHISLKWLREVLYDRCDAGKVLLILDCCYAGNIAGHGPDLEREELIRRLARYLDINVTTSANPKGLRWSLAATPYGEVAYEQDGHGPLARWLLPALSGEASEAIDYQGRVTFYTLRGYLQDKMSKYPPSASGGDSGRDCILAYHSKRPDSYFPYGHEDLFRPREGEFELLEPVLRGEQQTPVRLGLVGMGGVGKSQLARELVLRTRDHFTDGVFWATATQEGQSVTAPADNPLLHALAGLARQARYLPPGDDPARPNEELRARHLCRYLAQHPRALLILDNVENPLSIMEALPELAGESLQCAFLFTARESFAPPGVRTHKVVPLEKEQDLLYVLLSSVAGKEELLALEARGETDAQLEAAHSICKRVGGLPLALVLLRSQLQINSWLTLVELDQELRRNGVLDVAQDEVMIKRSLRATFQSSWRRVENEQAQSLFLLASYFMEAVPIPLWLISLASGLPEDDSLNSDLMRARRLLVSLSLVEDVSKSEIQMHSLLREFGQELVAKSEVGRILLQTAAERVVVAFEDVLRLEERTRAIGYWHCLSQIRAARVYLSTIQPAMQERLRRIEQRLDRETFFLAASGFWPDKTPGLFYQQMYNRLLEEQQPLPPPPLPGTQWLRQLERVGIEDKGPIRVFAGHTGGVNSVAFSHDSSRVLTGSEDATARIFETATGKTLHILQGHSKVIDSVAYSPDDSYVLTGSRDSTVRLWSSETGECLHIFEGHTDWVNTVAFSPDGNLIASGSQDGTARVWELYMRQLRAIFSSQNEPVYILNLFGELVLARNEDLPSDPYTITSITFSPDNTSLVIGTGFSRIFLWNLIDKSYSVLQTGARGSVTSIVYSQDGTRLLFSDSNGNIKLWDWVESACKWEFRISSRGSFNLASSHDPSGLYFLTGSWDGVVRLWDTREKRLLYEMEKQVGTINSVAFSPDDTTILVGLSNATAQLWERIMVPAALASEYDLSDREEIYVHGQALRPSQAYLFCTYFSPDGSRILASWPDTTTIHVWDVHNQRKTSLPLSTSVSGNFTVAGMNIENGRAFYFHNENLLTISFMDKLEMLNISSRKVLRSTTLKGRHNASFATTFSSDGHYFLGGAIDHKVVIWYASNGRVVKLLKGHTDIIMSIACSPDGKYFLTGSRDKTARLWELQDTKYVPVVLSGHAGFVTKVAFSQDGARAFTGSSDGLLRVWETATGNLLATLDGQTASITVIACSPEDTYVLTGDMFNQVRIWNRGEDYRLVGAYTTQSKVLTAHWQDERHVWVIDSKVVDEFPRIYKLGLEE